ncbi:ATP/GTP-binding protein [Bdellovibrionota bacterium FG-2]
MLIQFVVENFLSFRDEAVFRMTATSDAKHLDHVFTVESQKLSLLRSTAIYGANGAGKTNLVVALEFIQGLVTNGIKPKQKIPLRRFKLSDESAQKPSRFEVELLKDETRYSYGIVLDDTTVREEWLFATRPNGREVPYFERATTSDGNTQIKFGSQLKIKYGEDFLTFLAKGTRPEQPFIAEAESRNVKQIQPFIDWFRDSLSIVRTAATYGPLPLRISRDKNFTCALAQFLKAAGTGIETVETNEEDLDFDKHFPEMPITVRQEILADLNEKTSLLLGQSSPEDDLTMITGGRENPKLLRIHTVHRGKNGKNVRFAFSEESAGTKRLIHLFPALFSLSQKNQVFIIDELDRSMHPLLSRHFFAAFLENAAKTSQLIITTHEECLLDLDLVRRDEVWFMEKDTEEASHCYPLTDFKVRPDLEIQKGYLNGRFGAIPFFGDVKSLGWSA